jgi:hypothetical protein
MMAVGLFQVMATLQAARAFELGLPMESAQSWGLNRAIFYAAAKRGFKGKPPAAGRPGGTKAKTTKETTRPYPLGDEVAYSEEKDGKTYFVIGSKPQTEKDFEKQIESRFGGSFPEVWEEALDYVRHFDRSVLLSGNEFFSTIYKPKRDEFAEKWTEMSDSKRKPSDGRRPARRKR